MHFLVQNALLLSSVVPLRITVPGVSWDSFVSSFYEETNGIFKTMLRTKYMTALFCSAWHLFEVLTWRHHSISLKNLVASGLGEKGLYGIVPFYFMYLHVINKKLQITRQIKFPYFRKNAWNAKNISTWNICSYVLSPPLRPYPMFHWGRLS